VGGPRSSTIGLSFELRGSGIAATLDLNLSFVHGRWGLWSYTHSRAG
jgi:hypothetical protein